MFVSQSHFAPLAKSTRALGPGREAEQLPGPTAAGICLPLPQQADGGEAEKEMAFLLNKKKK